MNQIKNTFGNKGRFFAQYWGQKILTYQNKKEVSIASYFSYYDAAQGFLDLKPLIQITDEDAIEIAKIWYDIEGNHTVFSGKDVIRAISDFSQHVTTFSKCIRVVDFLRSKGYALPWMGISVEDQIERGWVKLTYNLQPTTENPS